MSARSSSDKASSFQFVVEPTLEPVGQVDGPGDTDESRQLLNGVGGDREAGEHHAGRPYARSVSRGYGFVEPIST
jgi:hypothetical protein